MLFFMNDENYFKELLNLKDNNYEFNYLKDLLNYIIIDQKLLDYLIDIIVISSGVFGEDSRILYINLLENYKKEKKILNDKVIYESYLLNIDIANSIEHIINFVRKNRINNKNKIEGYISNVFLYLFEINLKQNLNYLNFEDIHNAQITELVGYTSNFYGPKISKISMYFLENYICWLKNNIDKNILELDIDNIDEYILYIKNNKCIFRDSLSYSNFMTGITEKFQNDKTFNNFMKDFNKICI